MPFSQSSLSASAPSISPASAAQGISMLAPIPVTSLQHPTHAFQSVHAVSSAVQMCDFPALFEDVTWLKNHPRPLAVSNTFYAYTIKFVYFCGIWSCEHIFIAGATHLHKSLLNKKIVDHCKMQYI
jgi:hypothetical protein